MPHTLLGDQVRFAHALLSGGNENTMTAALLSTLNDLAPTRVQAVFDVSQQGGGRPDVTLRASDGLVGYIEVKRPETLADAFTVRPSDGTYQVERYRRDGVPILLTDGLRFYDVSDATIWNPSTFGGLLARPFAEFNDPTKDAEAEQALRALLAIGTSTRPRYSLATAPLAMAAMVSRINDSRTDSLEAAWSAARAYLGLTSERRELGGGQVGEIVAFTLLAIAANLPTIANEGFVDAATQEWKESLVWRPTELPDALFGCLRDFREADSESRGTLLGTGGWVIVRSIAASLIHNGRLSWERLSALWDEYLGIAGQRATLGSWQTPPAVARYQADQVSVALRALGYSGFSDPNVTAIDPCCGTGVYLQEVAAAVEREVGSAAGLSRTESSPARLLGCDISPAAVAAAHIRLSALGVRPTLYMADTLRASPSRGSDLAANHIPVAMFDVDDQSFLSALANAVRHDDAEMRRWSGRAEGRDPILAIIGNPPYQRSGINAAEYSDRAWYDEYFDSWREGSGGRGSLQDPFVAFAAWAFRIARLGHSSFDEAPARGVVSFIANRSWVDGVTFAPFRAWLRVHSSSVVISDFGPGSRGNVGDRWSAQPFAIEAGTAIFTVTFGAAANATPQISYTRVAWVNEEVQLVGDEVHPEGDEDWTGKPTSRALIEESMKVNGIKTGSDAQWVRTTGDRDFGTRHAFRAFDNRFSPTTPPPKTRRGDPVLPGYARPSADWRREKLWQPFRARWDEGGWYLIGQAESAKPGPALHATRFLPDYHAFKGSEGGNILPVEPSTPVASAYIDEARRLGVSGMDFWYMVLAAAHHQDYWAEGTELAKQIADNRVEPPLPTSTRGAQRLVELGQELVDLWSLDGVDPVDFHGQPGDWHFELHNTVDALQVNGRRVLTEWRNARRGDWQRPTALEYARSVAALARVKAISGLVAVALNKDARGAL